MREFHCNKFKFIELEHVGYLAFDEKRQSVGWDEVCNHIDTQQKEIDRLKGRRAEQVVKIKKLEGYLKCDIVHNDNKGFICPFCDYVGDDWQ